MRAIIVAFLLLTTTFVNAQYILKGVIVDSITKQPLPFATIQSKNEPKAVISTIDGRFSITVKQHGPIEFSYSGHKGKSVFSSTLKETDTILLAPLQASMEEVIIRMPFDKISRIINTAIQNKPLHNPDQYTRYDCNIYYKMIVDMRKFGNYNMDSIGKRQDSLQKVRTAKRKEKDSTKQDTSQRITFSTPSHLFMTETYSKRLYKKPGQSQEIILASKVSGLSKTYFANMVTDVLPFHVYTDYIPLNGIDFINPIAKGWQGRYRFLLESEIMVDEDTVFILSYRPKRGTSFNSLSGLVYISSRGYAIAHFTGTNNATDSANNRFVKFEHTYQFKDGKWFPQELNYDFGIRRVPAPYLQIVWNGHSVIDSVSFDPAPSYKIDKAHPVKFSDSVDLHGDKAWERFRNDTLSLRERNTYKNMDSLMRKTRMETVLVAGMNLAAGRLPVGKVDVDVQRILAANQYEDTRLGLGLYTNNKISRYYSIGGWFGYGFKDKAAKYGGSLSVFPKGDKETRLSFSYQKNIRLTGEVTLHPELQQSVLSNWLLLQVDEFREYAISVYLKKGYWDISPVFARQEVGPLHYSFQVAGKAVTQFTTHEASISLRYAYGEKRVPFLDRYLSAGTKYPIVYSSISLGRISSDAYETTYYRALLAVRFSSHINRWGNDRFQLEGGMIHVENNEPLPRSLLLTGNGYRRSRISAYLWGGFTTMRPFDFYSDRYLSFFYKHDLDKNFWNLKWSKPYLTFAHNLIYGSLKRRSQLAGADLRSFENGYHESGLVLNRILKHNLGFTDIGLHGGVFYHWENGGTWKNNGVWVIGLSAGF
jgi:hypothetical protein